MKKIIASILAAFFVLLSPLSAYASTTESIMMFSTGSVSDEYAFMPLASVEDFSFTFRTGAYDMKSDTISWSNSRTFSVSNGASVSSGSTEYTFSYSPDKLFATEIQFDNIGKLSDIRVLLARINFGFYAPDSSLPNTLFFMNRDNIQFFKSYYTAEWSGTLRNGTTHFGSTASSTGSLPSGFIRPYTAYNNFFQSMIDLTLPLEVPPPSDWENFVDASSGSGNSVYNTGVTSFKITFVLNVNRDIQSEGGNFLFNFLNSGDQVTYRTYIGNNLAVIQSDNTNDSSGIGSVMSGLSSSISSLGSSVNTNIAQVKTQITQSTNTITTKIDTMANDVKTGLQNVVTSAQENTQNIINTVTQKVDEVKTGITEVKDSILDLPNKIQEMLLGLIVPDSETMADKYSEFSGLLEEKLGVIYQIPMMLFDFFDTIVNAATTPQTTLTLPAFQLPWIDGSTLTVWQPMEYKIIPEGMQVLSDLIKTITSMTVVVLTFNSVKRAYERFLRS